MISHTHTADTTASSRRRRAHAVARKASVLIAVGAMAVTAPVLAPAAGADAGHDPTPTLSATPKGWSEIATMPTARADGAGAQLADGRVLVVGGWDGTHYLASSELYDPASRSWHAGPDLPAAVSYTTATTLTNGKVLVAGDGTATYLFNPKTTRWEAGPTMPVADRANFAARLANGRVIVVGTGSTTEYNPRTNKWKSLATPSWKMYNTAATILPNGDIVAASQMSATTGPSVYNRARNTWTTLPRPPFDPGFAADVVTLPNGNVMVGGGWSLDSVLGFINPVFGVMEVNPTTGVWTSDAPVPGRHWTGVVPTDGSEFARLSNGSILATGGDFKGDVDYVYTPSTGTWANVPGRDIADFALVTLSDGSLMSIGGNTYDRLLLGPTARTAVFRP